MIVTQSRIYQAAKTVSDIYVDGEHFDVALEDIARPWGVKILGETCIPEGDYLARVTYSNRFKKELIQIYTNPTTMACEHGGIIFTGIRCHGGTTTEHTEGCLLLSRHEYLKELIKKVGVVKWSIFRKGGQARNA